MDLIDSLKNLSAKISKQKDIIATEEATKNAFIMPFIAALGYDVFDPTEVVPEFTADIGTKKNEKVDYAIMKDGIPQMFIECKKAGASLDYEYASQLYRYFATTSNTRIGVLTNGIVYQFYSDLEEKNMMDKKPFLEFNLLDVQEIWVNELKNLTKSRFNLDEILSAASDLKYMKETKRILGEMLINPSEDFVKFFLNEMYTGTKTIKVIQQFTEVIRKSFNQFINDKINERLKSAMTGDDAKAAEEPPPAGDELSAAPPKPLIDTTSDETESLYIVKSIVREVVDINRISLKDYQTQCNIILDEKATKYVLKLYFNGPKKLIGIFDENRVENKIQIESIQDIYKYSEQILISLRKLINGSGE